MLIGIDALFKKLLTFEFCRLFSLPRTNCLDTHHPQESLTLISIGAWWNNMRKCSSFFRTDLSIYLFLRWQGLHRGQSIQLLLHGAYVDRSQRRQSWLFGRVQPQRVQEVLVWSRTWQEGVHQSLPRKFSLQVCPLQHLPKKNWFEISALKKDL